MMARKSNQVRAFTLIELTMVMVIIVLLITATLKVVGYVHGLTSRNSAKMDIQKLALAMEKYRSDKGAYPTSSLFRTSTFGLAEITNSWLLYKQLTSGRYCIFPARMIRTQPTIIGTATNNFPVIIDPWDNVYCYYCTYPPTAGQVNQSAFDLWSYGPDRVNGTIDDITYLKGS